MRRPGPLLGALVGLLLTAALVASSFLLERLAGAPFPPFTLFDWLTRVLPGPVVTFGIDALVATIVFLNVGSVADVAKTAEQALAIGLFLVAGTVAGAVLFAMLRGRGSALVPGLLTGLVLGTGLYVATSTVSPAAATRPVATAVWILAALAAWGVTLGWSRDRLTPAPPSTPEAAPAAAPRDVAATAERLDRRRFLIRLGSATAVITVAGAGVGALLRGGSGPQAPTPGAGAASGAGAAPEPGWAAANPLPNAGAAVEPAPGTRPEYTLPKDHYRIDINMVPPDVDLEGWALQVTGLVNEPLTLDLAALQAYEPLHQFVTLACISNRVGGDLTSTTRWTGVPLQRLLPDLGLRDEATHLRISSVDGFYEYLPVATALADERVMLAYAWDGRPLPQRNGFPLRIYIPDVYGMKQPKWIDRIQAVDRWEAGYWVERGWDAEARMKATSVVDTVATDMMIGDADAPLIPIGGIAHAGARGIDRVEVRVDDGDWQQARLRTPLSGLTWVVWRYDWPFTAGDHTFTVRCVDGAGEAQIVDRAPPHPSGATGLHSERAML